MQQRPQYDDILSEVDAFFRERIAACLQAGMVREKIVLDPGFGFGKTLAHNLALLDGLPHFAARGCPLLVGLSRKSMLGAILDGAPVDQRLHAGVAAAAIAVLNGARILRVHDVKATCDAVAVASALLAARPA
jgi:dihydropteroate synthase